MKATRRSRLFSRNRALRGVFLPALCAVVIAAGSAGGEEGKGGEDDLSMMSLEDLMQIPVYAASRYEQNRDDAPSFVTIITADDIRAYGYRNLGEVLASAPGLYVTYDRSYRYLGVRGFNRPGDYNGRILLLVNGHRTNDGIYDSASFDEALSIDLDLIDRIEIVRGPGSSLYGTSAIFAVINIITREGDDIQGVEVSQSIGSFGAAEGRVTYGCKISDTRSILFSALFVNGRGQDLYFPEFDSPDTFNGVARGADGVDAQNIFLLCVRDDLRVEVSYGGRKKTNPTAAWETIFGDPGTSDCDRQFMTDLGYTWKIGGDTRVESNLRYQRYTYEGDMAYDNAEEGEPPDRVLNRDSSHAAWWGGEVRVSTEAVKRNRLSVGAAYRDNFQVDLANADVGSGDAPLLDERRKYRITGLYAQDEIKVAEWALVNAGVRYDRMEPAGHGDVSPRAALILKPTGTTNVKLLFGEAFRSPNAYEMYYNDGGRTMKANPALEPETIRTYEVVVDQGIGANQHLSLSVFRYRIENLVSQAVDPEDELLYFANMEAATAEGAEICLQRRIPGRLEGRLSYSYTDARDEATGKRLDNSPRHLAKLNAIVPVVKNRLSAGLEVQYTGERKTLGGGTLEDFVVANLSFVAKDVVGRCSLSAGVYNIFDRRYGVPAGGEHAQDSLEQDGRTFRVKLACKF